MTDVKVKVFSITPRDNGPPVMQPVKTLCGAEDIMSLPAGRYLMRQWDKRFVGGSLVIEVAPPPATRDAEPAPSAVPDPVSLFERLCGELGALRASVDALAARMQPNQRLRVTESELRDLVERSERGESYRQISAATGRSMAVISKAVRGVLAARKR